MSLLTRLQNIEDAKKKIAEIEKAEEEGVNGDKVDKVDEVTSDLKETSVSDKQES